MFFSKFLVQNSSILGQFQKAYVLTDPYSTTELKGWWKQGREKDFFSNLCRNSEGGIP